MGGLEAREENPIQLKGISNRIYKLLQLRDIDNVSNIPIAYLTESSIDSARALYLQAFSNQLTRDLRVTLKIQ
jgi:hypothetical protein